MAGCICRFWSGVPDHGFSALKTAAGVSGHGVGVPDSIRQFGEGILRRHGAPDMELLERLRGLRSIPEHLAFQSGEYCSTGETETSHWGLQQAAY